MTPRPSFAVVTVAALAVMLLSVVGLRGQQGDDPRPPRTAVVDVEKVFSSLSEKSAVEADITQEAERLQREEQERQAEVRELQSDLSILSPEADAYNQAREKLERKAIEFEAWRKFNQQRLEREKAIRIERLFQKVVEATERVAEENGYDLVLQKDSRAIQAKDQQQLTNMILQRKVLYAREDLDITDEVIQVSNNEYNNRSGGD